MGGRDEGYGKNQLSQELKRLREGQVQPLGTTDTPVLKQLADVGNFLLGGVGEAAQGLQDYKDPAGAAKREFNKQIANQFVRLPEADNLSGPQRQLFLKFAQTGDVDEMQQVLSSARSAQEKQQKNLGQEKFMEAARRAVQSKKNELSPEFQQLALAAIEAGHPLVGTNLLSKGRSEDLQAIQEEIQGAKDEISTINQSGLVTIPKQLDVIKNTLRSKGNIDPSVFDVDVNTATDKEIANTASKVGLTVPQFKLFKQQAEASGIRLTEPGWLAKFWSKPRTAPVQAAEELMQGLDPTSLEAYQELQRKQQELINARAKKAGKKIVSSQIPNVGQERPMTAQDLTAAGTPPPQTITVYDPKTGQSSRMRDVPEVRALAAKKGFQIR